MKNINSSEVYQMSIPWIIFGYIEFTYILICVLYYANYDAFNIWLILVSLYALNNLGVITYTKVSDYISNVYLGKNLWERKE